MYLNGVIFTLVYIYNVYYDITVDDETSVRVK